MLYKLNQRYGFRDIEEFAGSNHEHGLDYCAAGIVKSFYVLPDEAPSVSGKDISVCYISPLGEHVVAWRTFNEIHLIELSDTDYEHLDRSIENLETFLG